MSQNHSNKSRTQILDLDESMQLSDLSRSDLRLINGGMRYVCVPCSCLMGGGEDYDWQPEEFLCC